MTSLADGRAGSRRTGPEPDSAERGLLVRVLDALLREDHLELASAGAPLPPAEAATGLPVLGPCQRWWRAPLPGGGAVLLAVRPDGFLADDAVAAPLLVLLAPPGGPAVVRTLDAALAALAPRADAEAVAGWADFRAECAQALATARLHDDHRPVLYAALGRQPGAAGFVGLLRHEALAALRDHPVHPTGRARLGLDAGELRRYAPEFQPRFRLRWAVVPRSQVRISPALAAAGPPAWWPALSELGAGAGLGPDHVAVPVHPLTAARGHPEVTTVPALDVVPTLSTRTVALAADPGTQLKLPLPTATLGHRNRRTIAPGTLADGDTVHRLLRAVLRREPDLARGVLLADESRWIDGADELLAVLVRRFPTEIAGDILVPLAALLAADPHDLVSTLLDRLADGDPLGWFDGYLTTLLDWHVALWLRYGIALEAHQQNVTLAVGPGRLRLVYKDDDGARIDCVRLAAALGDDAPLPVTPAAFHDRRIAATDPAELADLFVTITLHLCVGALVVEHVGPDRTRRAALFALARTRLEEAVLRWCDPSDAGSVAAARLLRRRVLDADRWPVKAMVTAGTLLAKHRLGCTDVNKHYRYSGPNYLRTRGDGAISASSDPSAGPGSRVGLGRGHVFAVTAAHCSAAFAALGLPLYLPLLLPELGDPAARWAGVLYVVPTLCAALSAPLWGRLADRYGRRALLVRAQLGLAVAFGLAALAGNVPMLAAALAAQGLLGGTFAASAAYLASGLQGAALARALTLMQGSARAALAAAPVLAGLLASELSVRQLYGLAAALPLAAAGVTLLLPEPSGPSGPSGPLPASPEAGPAGPRVTVGGLAVAEAGFVLATVVTFPYFLPLTDELLPGLPPAVGGLLFAVPHLCYLLAAAPALRLLRERPRAGLAGGYALAAVSALLHGVPVLVPAGPPLAWLVAGRLLLGAALACGLTALAVLAAEAAAGRAPGRLFGVVEAWSKGGAVVAGVAASAFAIAGPATPLAVAVVTGTALTAAATRITARRPDREIRSRPCASH